MKLKFNPNASKAAIEAAKKLIERYNEITVEDVVNAKNSRKKLTGFGFTSSCTLCRACRPKVGKPNCKACIYFSDETARHCLDGCNKKTYDNIRIAKTPKQLVAAFKNRAAHVTKIVELIEKHQQSCN